MSTQDVIQKTRGAPSSVPCAKAEGPYWNRREKGGGRGEEEVEGGGGKGGGEGEGEKNTFKTVSPLNQRKNLKIAKLTEKGTSATGTGAHNDRAV